jgi:TM2 domain-containing membrane protein YozV
MAFCDSCGHKLRSKAKFCASCGTAREPTDDTPKTRRSKPVQPRKKSREEELAEYEEEHLRTKLNLQPKSKSESRTVGEKQNVNSGKVLQRPIEWKSMGVTIVLTVVLGFFGLGGIGHIYLGKIIKGIVILIVGIILLIITILTSGIGLIVLIPYAIWVVYDSYKLCKRYNNDLEQTGRPPW